MKRTNEIFWIALSVMSLATLGAACGNLRTERSLEAGTVFGQVTVDLDVNKSLIRTKEMPAGNFVADAYFQYATSRGYNLDFAVANSGAIRCDTTRTSGIYPAGDFTSAIAKEIHPFANTPVIVQMTGAEIKSMFEWSGAKLPVSDGRFLQVSKQVQVVYDKALTAQANDSGNTVVLTAGTRVTSLKINGVEYNPSGNYNVIMSNYTAGGGDNYVVLKDIPSSRKITFSDDLMTALTEYVQKKTPVTPATEGRITILN